jgi:hypothetical protein
MNNFAVTNIYTKNILPLAVITTEYNKRKYCEKHNYDLIIKTNNFTYKDIGFNKIDFVLNTLKSNKYDWVYWCGCDTMITNYDITLESMIDDNYEFIISYDVWDFNSDSFLIKNSPTAIKYFEHILSLYDKYIDSNGTPVDNGLTLPDGGARAWAEQGAMIDLYSQYHEYKSITKTMPQKFMNSYLYNMYPSPWHSKGLDCKGNPGSWSEGDFLVHWPGMDNKTRINLALKFLSYVKGDLDN